MKDDKLQKMQGEFFMIDRILNKFTGGTLK